MVWIIFNYEIQNKRAKYLDPLPYYFDKVTYLLSRRFSPAIMVSIKAISYAQTVISLDML